VAVAPEDGAVVARVTVPFDGPEQLRGIAWHDESLVVTLGGTEHHGGPSRLLLLDSSDGSLRKDFPINAQWGPCGGAQIGENLWIAHGCWLCVVSPKTEQSVIGGSHYGSWPVDLAFDGKDLWHTDEWAPFVFRSDLEDHMLDFAEQPFLQGTGNMPSARGITHDGNDLWALDDKNKRICTIERNLSDGES